MGTHGVKIVVIYPRPQDEEAFEKVYLQEHVPLAEAKLKGRTRIVLTKVVSSPQGKESAYRMAEVHFSSMDDQMRRIGRRQTSGRACHENLYGRAAVDA